MHEKIFNKNQKPAPIHEIQISKRWKSFVFSLFPAAQRPSIRYKTDFVEKAGKLSHGEEYAR